MKKKLNGEIARGDYWVILDRNKFRGKWPCFYRYAVADKDGRTRATMARRETAFEIAEIKPRSTS